MASREPKWMPLSLAAKFEPMAKERGVSDVARSKRGFFTQYKKVGGRFAQLDPWWRNRRNNFVNRHMAQVRKHGEKLVDSQGRPTRRHLALIMWAYSPFPAKSLKKMLREYEANPAEASAVTLYHGTTRAALPSILARGLEPSAGWGGAGTEGVYLAGSPQGALYWAKMSWQCERGEKMDAERFDRAHPDPSKVLAVLAVQVPAEAVDRLKADEEQFEDYGVELDPDDWQGSLVEIGDVRFEGHVPPEWLSERPIATMMRRNPMPLTQEQIEALGQAYLKGVDIAGTPKAQEMARAQAYRVMQEFEKLRQKIRIEFTERDPYASFAELQADVLGNGHMWVFTGFSDTPLWSPELNWMSRAVHDFDHVLANTDFSLPGEIHAYQVAVARAPELEPLYLSEIALQAASSVVLGGVFPEGPQKLVFAEPSVSRVAQEFRRNDGEEALEEHLADLMTVWDAAGALKTMTPEQLMQRMGAEGVGYDEAMLVVISAILAADKPS